MRLLPLFVILGTFVSSCAKAPVTENGTGGAVGSGGATGKGGATGTGGVTGTGGKIGTGGATSTGGTTSTGGSTVAGSVDCTDTSTYSNLVTSQYGATAITVDNNSNKTYFMQANWWGTPYNSQQEQITGLGFSMTNPPPNNVTSVKDTPMGFPSIFIGTYGTKATKGSNLPKQISSLTSVPTIFSTNADSHGTSNFNATYDVWLTQSSAVVTGGNPGSGGAYLMVWLFKPSDRQPNGSPLASGRFVDGVSGTWTVWNGTSNSLPCISYVSDTPLSSLQFDLNNFIQDAITNKYGSINTNQYLSIIFAGFEVWGGGDGLKVNKFCANVK
jgi:hypothetical protein